MRQFTKEEQKYPKNSDTEQQMLGQKCISS